MRLKAKGRKKAVRKKYQAIGKKEKGGYNNRYQTKE